MAELPSNPVPFSVLEETDTPPRIGLELTAYSFEDPYTPLGVLPDRFALKCMDEIEGPSGGSFRVFRNDPKLVEIPNILDYENIFKVSVDGKVVGAFIKGSEDTDFVNQNEKSGEYIESSGEGLRGWFHHALVEPYRGIRTDSQYTRVFSFASERGSWYKSADWKTPVLIQQHSLDPNDGPFNTAPADWPDAPSAYWIWGEANNGTTNPATEGLNFFRYEFTITGVTGTAPYAVFAAAKDHFQVFLDGQQIIEAKEDDAYSKTWRADFDLNNGDHVLAIKVLSKGTGAAGVIAALFKSGDATAGTEAQLIKVTNASGWKVNAYPNPAPGWTPGEIMLTLLDEAEGRGIRFPTYLTPTFTATHDSDGAAWSRALDWSFDIGTEYIDVIEKLEELVCDVWINPDNYELNLYAERGAHRDVQAEAVEPIKFEIAKNVTRAQATGTSEIKNALLMQTEDGWTTITDAVSDSIAKYGRREGYVSTGASNDVSSDLARRIFKQKAKPAVASTYDVIDVDGARPFFDFGTGDWVLAPSEADEMLLVPRRTMSLSVTEDDDNGQPLYAIEFDTIAQDLARRFDRWLKTTSDGTLGGTLANVQGGGGGGGGATPSGQTTQTGPAGSTGPRGFPGFRNRGIWEEAQVYQISDTVAWDGTWWVASAETNEEPGPLADDWLELEVAPTTTPAIGATFYLTGNFSAPNVLTAIPWTGERYKSNITHLANSSTIVIQDPGPYIIAGKFAITSNAQRDYFVQVNGTTIFSTNTYPVNSGSTRGIADLDAYLVNLAVGDVVRVMTSGAATHSIQSSTDTWISIAKITGARGEPGAKGDPGDDGEDGTDGTDGQGYTWRGAWASGVAYAAYDTVRENGTSYVATAAHNSSGTTLPGVGADWATVWSVIAQKGADGGPGPQGPPGANLVIIGTLASEGDLPATGEPGDAYLIDGDLYIWSLLLEDWENVGPFGGSGGGGGGGGGGYSAGNYVITTPSLPSMDSWRGRITLNTSEANQALQVTADAAMRIRIYASAEQQDADDARPTGLNPTGNHGVLLDVAFRPDDELTQVVSPAALLFNIEELGTAPYVTITNLSTSERTITTTLLVKGMASAAQGGSDAGVYIKTTGSLSNGASEQFLFALSSAELHYALALSADVPCRVRFYASTAQRSADLSRPVGTDPVGNHGVLLDLELTPGKLEYVITPSVALFAPAGFGAIPATITNKSGAADTVTVSLTAKGI